MTVATDPLDYAEVDKNNANSSPLPLDQSFNGWQDEDFYKSADQNVLHQYAARWRQWHDQSRAPSDQLGYSISMQLSATRFSYGVGPGLIERVPIGDAHVIVFGSYVPLTLARLAHYQPALVKYTFTASRSHHFHVGLDGLFQIEVVALGTPHGAFANYDWIYSADTNATHITAETIGDNFVVQERRVVMQERQYGALINEIEMRLNNGDLILNKASGVLQRMFFMRDGDDTLGWQLDHTTGNTLRINEVTGGVPIPVVDFGSTSATVNLQRQLSISSNSLTVPVLRATTGVVGAAGVIFDGFASDIVTIIAQGSSVPLVMTPTTPGFLASNAKGSIKLDNSAASNLTFKDNNNATRTTWATQGGPSLTDAYTLATLSGVAVGTVVQTFNYSFLAGRRYLIRMSCRVGRAAASTRDASMSCTVGGVSLAFHGQTVSMFQVGAAGQLEAFFADEAVYTAASTATLAVQLLVSPVNGAGNINIGARLCRVLGHFDP